jgi:hypothetical protein
LNPVALRLFTTSSRSPRQVLATGVRETLPRLQPPPPPPLPVAIVSVAFRVVAPGGRVKLATTVLQLAVTPKLALQPPLTDAVTFTPGERWSVERGDCQLSGAIVS